MTGRTISHYQILELLGSGGMGEVFQARDTRLNRLVAIKTLRPERLSEAVRKQRFIQEAQAASALNHPNIVTIYDIGQADGVDFMVMEYVPGATLDARIPRQGMRLNEALRIAIQIAEGLRRAHSAGIVHRDLKPSNIMVGDEGQVKILDFGLAKLTEKAEISADEATRTLRLETEEGTILGTTAYMSPEQAEGRKLDARTDIFSFGTVLYEMLTGRKAFVGDTRVATVSAILKEEPKPVENIPAELDKILRRCLRKDREKRIQHMDDVKLALEDVREDSESGNSTAATPAAPARSRVYIAAGFALAALAGGYFWWQSRATAPAATGYTLRQITSDGKFATTPALSPDGKFIAYASDRQSEGNLDLWVQPLTAGARPIRLTTNAADDMAPDFSPDGSSIVFYSKREGGGIYTIPYLGGEERLLAKGKMIGGVVPRYSPDGKWIAYSTGLLSESQVVVVPAAGGPTKVLATNLSNAEYPVWSPDGRHLIARTRTAGGWSVIPADGGPATNIGGKLPQAFVFSWIPGFLLCNWQRQAWAVPIEAGTWKIGTPRKLLESTAGFYFGRATGLRNEGPEQISFAGQAFASHLWSLELDSNTGKTKGAPQLIAHTGGDQTQPALSADGRFLAYSQELLERRELRVRDLQAGKDTLLVTGSGRPKFSPDGTHIAYLNGEGVFLSDRSGGDTVKLRDAKRGFSAIYGWHPRGITYWDGSPIRFSLLDPVSKQLRDLISHPKLSIHGAELSPDGNWLAFHTPGPSREPLYVAPVRDGKAAGPDEWILIAETAGFNRRPWWSLDGNLLYWLSDRDGPAGIWAQRLGPGKHPQGAAFPVIQFPETRRGPNTVGAAAFGPGVTRDRIIFSMDEQSGEIWLAEANR